MSGNQYETRRYLHEYLLLHYGQPKELGPFSSIPRDWLRFHNRLRQEFLLPIPSRATAQGLDLGCAVGRFTFELGRVLNRVTGIDSSRSFIRAARQMAKRHSLRVAIQETGSQVSSIRLILPQALWRSRVQFRVGDAMALAAFPDQAFQVVTAINLIDRLPQPRAFLSQLPRLLSPGGQLLIASPFTWLREYTPPQEWLSSKRLQELFRPSFRLARHGDLPFFIREHRRKFQLVVAEVFTFVRHPLRSSAGIKSSWKA
ncbi:MAG TPA: methyltransferase domain-containing protein [Terriglobia bacterium]|nr:methyltransferase domain-containing protein [Terriglobia bacterium]